jgi:release factor glutamine methyltransferase
MTRRNLAGYRAVLHEGDLSGPLPASLKGTIDTLPCSTPSVPSVRVQTLPAEARVHVPW